MGNRCLHSIISRFLSHLSLFSSDTGRIPVDPFLGLVLTIDLPVGMPYGSASKEVVSLERASNLRVKSDEG